MISNAGFSRVHSSRIKGAAEQRRVAATALMIQSRVLMFVSIWSRRVFAVLLASGLVACHRNAGTRVTPLQPTTLRQAAAAHHIKMGTAVASFRLSEPKYAEVLAAQFSQVEPENEMKFALVEPAPDRYDFRGGDALVAFAQAHNMAVRGHTLVWHHQVPQWVSSSHDSPAQLADILHEHIRNVVQHYAGKVYAWDVVNEAFNDDGTMRSTVWYDSPGIGFAGQGTKYIEQALRWAHAADPKAKLFYNDFDTEAVNAKSNAIYAMAKDFKTRHVPLDGIGFQCHVTLEFDTPERLASFAANLKRFADLGLQVQFTELDIRLTDATPASLAAQAKLYGEITRICAEQPRCTAIQTWGLTDKYSWVPRAFKGMGHALLWDEQYQKKPAFDAVMNALRQ